MILPTCTFAPVVTFDDAGFRQSFDYVIGAKFHRALINIIKIGTATRAEEIYDAKGEKHRFDGIMGNPTNAPKVRPFCFLNYLYISRLETENSRLPHLFSPPRPRRVQWWWWGSLDEHPQPASSLISNSK